MAAEPEPEAAPRPILKPFGNPFPEDGLHPFYALGMVLEGGYGVRMVTVRDENREPTGNMQLLVPNNLHELFSNFVKSPYFQTLQAAYNGEDKGFTPALIPEGRMRDGIMAMHGEKQRAREEAAFEELLARGDSQEALMTLSHIPVKRVPKPFDESVLDGLTTRELREVYAARIRQDANRRVPTLTDGDMEELVRTLFLQVALRQ